jgi:3-hydroxyacyl-[acyl-carrier-protein] dehydratase
MAFEEILKLVPQKDPFRFIEEILELDENHIVGKYTFKPDEYFYQGHFPGDPVTPGVVLIETMAQTGVVAFGLYLTSKISTPEELPQWTTFFTDCKIDFYRPVLPGETVIVRGKKVYFRKMKLQTNVQLFSKNNDLIAEGVVSGMGVKRG